MASFGVPSDSPERTAAIAGALARHLRAGDVVLLAGGLATGKTTFVGGAAAALGSAEPVTSPTFALVHIYTCRPVPLLHIDAYRLSGVHEFRDLGLDEYIEESITLIEWGDIVADDFPCCLSIEFEFVADSATQRRLTLRPVGDGWAERLPELRDDLSAAARPVGSTAS
jgi:tRNA threonylcarbamoyladenosine biosynthesis protein TsaE